MGVVRVSGGVEIRDLWSTTKILRPASATAQPSQTWWGAPIWMLEIRKGGESQVFSTLNSYAIGDRPSRSLESKIDLVNRWLSEESDDEDQ